MRRPQLALALVLPAIAVALTACFADKGDDAALPPFTPVSRAVETDIGILVGSSASSVGAERGAVRLDARTLEELPGRIDIQSATLDQSGRYVAALEPRGDVEKRKTLLVYDLESWELAWTMGSLPSGQLQWEPNGLYLWGEACAQPGDAGTCRTSWDRGLWRITPEGASELAKFDFGILPRTSAISPDGSRAYVVGIDTDVCCGIDVKGPPFVATIDIESGSVDRTLPLPELLVGQPGNWFGRTDIGGGYWPAAVLSPDGSRMYIAHSERDEITTVDLENQQVLSSQSFEDGPSVMARLGGWLRGTFVRTAEAKSGAEYLRRLSITPDGQYLLVAGSQPLVTAENANPDDGIPLGAAGLSVIDVDTMSVVYKDDNACGFTLAPDGYSLLTWGYPSFATTPHGLRIVDLRTMESRQLFDGELVSAVAAAPSGRSAVAEIAGLVPGQRSVVSFDIATGDVTAESRSRSMSG